MLVPEKSGRYISVKGDGKFHEKASKETEGAKERTWIDRDTGQMMSKWELVYRAIENVWIKDIAFEDSEYGENIFVTLSDDEYEVVWAENTKGNFATDLMKKLPNIDLSEKVSIKPYAFEDGKKGVAIFQKDKVFDYFWDAEKKEKLNGFPEWPKKQEDMKKDDWQVYFIQVKSFLTDYTKEHILPKFDGVIQQSAEKIEYGEDVPNPEDIPF